MLVKPTKKGRPVLWALMAICLIGGLTALELTRSYHAAVETARSRNDSLAGLSAQRLTGALREIDYIMRDIQDRVDEDRLNAREGPDGEEARWINSVLTGKLHTHPWLFAIGVMNAEGVFAASVTRKGLRAMGEDFLRREYFTYPATHPESNGFCSGAYVGKAAGGSWLSCSRTIRKKGSPSFAGVVVVGLEGRYFRRLFGSSDFADNGAIAVVDAAGRLLFRTPEIPATVGRKANFSALAGFQAGIAKAGQAVAVSPLDGKKRLFAFHRVEFFPYTVVVSTPVEDDLRQWHVQCYSYLAGLALIAGLLLGLAFLAGRLQRVNVRLLDQAGELEQQAHTDPLTGVGNRRHFFELAERELMRSRRMDRPLALLMLDIDHFKGINDTYGHDAGDAVLKALCATGNGIVRNIDIFARFGGEEFAVLLPETGDDQARMVAERLRMHLAETAVALPDGRTVSFTVSIGLAVMASREEGLEDLLKRADTALYEAKDKGRNQV